MIDKIDSLNSWQSVRTSDKEVYEIDKSIVRVENKDSKLTER